MDLAIDDPTARLRAPWRVKEQVRALPGTDTLDPASAKNELAVQPEAATSSFARREPSIEGQEFCWHQDLLSFRDRNESGRACRFLIGVVKLVPYRQERGAHGVSTDTCE